MTIIAAVLSRDGLLVAADRMKHGVEDGSVDTEKKVRPLGRHAALGLAGVTHHRVLGPAPSYDFFATVERCYAENPLPFPDLIEPLGMSVKADYEEYLASVPAVRNKLPPQGLTILSLFGYRQDGGTYQMLEMKVYRAKPGTEVALLGPHDFPIESKLYGVLGPANLSTQIETTDVAADERFLAILRRQVAYADIGADEAEWFLRKFIRGSSQCVTEPGSPFPCVSEDADVLLIEAAGVRWLEEKPVMS